jgi:hypothetical protein
VAWLGKPVAASLPLHVNTPPLCLCINLQELLAIQQSDGPKNLGFFGTRNMGMTHQKLVEILSYAMVSTVRRLHTGCAVSSTAHRLGRLLRSRRLS